MSESKHTPTPWTYCGSMHKNQKPCKCGFIYSRAADCPVAKVERGNYGDKLPVLEVKQNDMSSLEIKARIHLEAYGSISDEVADANAEFIVRACNCYEELLEACESIVREIKAKDGVLQDECIQLWLPVVEQAIAKATEK